MLAYQGKLQKQPLFAKGVQVPLRNQPLQMEMVCIRTVSMEHKYCLWPPTVGFWQTEGEPSCSSLNMCFLPALPRTSGPWERSEPLDTGCEARLAPGSLAADCAIGLGCLSCQVHLSHQEKYKHGCHLLHKLGWQHKFPSSLLLWKILSFLFTLFCHFVPSSFPPTHPAGKEAAPQSSQGG